MIKQHESNKPDAVASTQILKDALAKSGLPYREFYREVYLQSEHWDELKKKLRSERGNKCEDCKSSGPLDCHHVNYRSLYDVTTDDLMLLCRECHAVRHGIAPSVQYLPPIWKEAFNDEWSDAVKSGLRGIEAMLVAVKSLIQNYKKGAKDRMLKAVFDRLLTEWNRENLRRIGLNVAKRKPKKQNRRNRKQHAKRTAQRNLEHLSERGRL